MKDMIIIKKILNNSAVLVLDSEQEYIYMGPGIAFGKKIGMSLEHVDKVEKIFSLKNNTSKFGRLLYHYKEEMAYVMDAVAILVNTLPNNHLEDEQFLSFCDHVAIMYQRVLHHEDLFNPFLYEIKALYKTSFQLAQQLSSRLEKLHEITIPESEIALIALHIENIVQDKSKITVESLNRIMIQIKDLLEEEYHFNFIAKEDEYGRFITHVKFLMDRAFRNTQMKTDLCDVIVEKYGPYVVVANKVANILNKELDRVIIKDEIAFLTIHMKRLIEI